MVLTIEGSGDPVKDGSPQIDPSDKLQIVGRVRLTFYDVEYGLVEYGDGTGDACNTERLGAENGEDEGGHERRQKHFGDAILLCGLYQI